MYEGIQKSINFGNYLFVFKFSSKKKITSRKNKEGLACQRPTHFLERRERINKTESLHCYFFLSLSLNYAPTKT